ncbi:MAG TPA: phosphatidylinositol mannoside acyltransferase [Streptosporangiaceae bacterium]|nr:phosphatidylinositol mannoside acyltransferase [Streptosporangiaceae bacterium]
MEALKDRMIAAGYSLGWTVVKRMPEAWARTLFMLVAEIIWRRQGRGVQQLEANLRRVVGPAATGTQLRELSRAGMRSYLRYFLEIFRLPVIGRERILANMRSGDGEEAAFAYMAAGRGVIFALPHMGNWDHAGAWIILRGAGSFTTVEERLRPEALYQKFLAFREGLGFEALPLTGGAAPFGVMAQRLRAGGMVCLVCDRDLTASGVEVRFFGETARMAAGPAALAVQTGAALIPVTLWFEGDLWHADISSAVPVPADGTRKEKVAVMTQQMANVFETGIREHPEDWHMLQKVFVADLDPDRLAVARASAAVGAAGNADKESADP